jgi:UDP-GlcNAc:undecaprenyl-phosphate GlcNAc-1-phosphate transferase
MTSIIVAFFSSLAVATVLTPLVLKLALKHKLYDQPNERKVHSRPIPRLGGVAIVIAFFAPLTGLLLVRVGMTVPLTESPSHLIGLFVGGLIIAALGLYDDLKGADAKKKFAVQVLVAILMWALGYRIELLSNPFGGQIALGWFSLPLTVFWFVGVMNAVNLIDGLDGLAGGVSLISISTLMALAIMDDKVLAALMSACLAGALVGFLFFNFNPARIFMGDTGSLFLGFVLAAFSISTSSKGSTAIAIAVPLLVLALPILDTLLAIGRRVRARRPIFSADQEHIHHRLLRAGFTHRGAVLVLYGVALSLAGFALLSRAVSQPMVALLLLGAALVLFVLLRLLSSWQRQPRGLHDPFGADGLKARVALDAAGLRMTASTGTAQLADELNKLAAVTRCVSVVLTGPSGRVLYVHDRPLSPHETMRPLIGFELPLEGGQDPNRLDAAPGETPAELGKIELTFVREEDQSDLGVILPWERVRGAVARAMEKHGWAPLQSPIPPRTTGEREVEQLNAQPLPAWTRATTRPGSRSA